MEASRLHLSKDQTIATQREFLPQMLRFYGELAGGGPQDLDEAGQVFRFGKSRLILQPAAEPGDAPGLNLSFDTRDSISNLAAEFMRKGIHVIKGPEERAMRRGVALAIRKSVWLADPAGNTVEIGRYLYDYGPAWLGWYRASCMSSNAAAAGGIDWEIVHMQNMGVMQRACKEWRNLRESQPSICG